MAKKMKKALFFSGKICYNKYITQKIKEAHFYASSYYSYR